MKRIIPARRAVRPRASRPAGPSHLEEAFALHLLAERLPAAQREYRFARPERQWRFDFAWPELMVAAEVEGGTRSGGRHTRGSGYEADCEKYNAAALRGWRVFRFTGAMVLKGQAVGVIAEAINQAISDKDHTQ